MPSFTQVVETIMTPSPLVIFIGALIILGAPVVLHILLSSSRTYTVPPTVLLLGPSNAGKTTLQSLYERGSTGTETHTSQVTQSVELNASTDSANKTFRNHASSDGTYTKFLLIDTPGHPKLRNTAMEQLAKTEKLKSVVFMVDAGALGEHDTLAPTAAYLYEVLLALQKRATAKGAKTRMAVPVLIAANKMDLFTALPSTMVRSHLEAELTRIRASKSKGLLDSGVGENELGSEEQDSWLGEYGSTKFTFNQLREFDIEVDVIPGSVTGDGPGAEKWWWWVAQRV